MKIARSCMLTSLDIRVEPRFGRCQVVLVVDTDTLAVESLRNTSVGAANGADIEVPR
jgi:predicted Fe-Mo cluster-binding NifX family protein